MLIHYSVLQTELKKGNKHRGFEHSFEKFCYKEVRVHWGKSKRRVVVVQSLSVSDSFLPHGLQHTWLPCPSLSAWVCSNSCPLSQLSNVERSRIQEVLCFKMEGIEIDLHTEREDLVERKHWCKGERGNYWRDRLELTGGEAIKCKQNWWV